MLGMNQLSKYFLSSTALSSKQNCNVGTRSLFEFLTDLTHDRGLSKDCVIRGQARNWLEES